MSRNLEWLSEGDSVKRAAKLMADAGIGFLPICDAQRRVIGVVTDRDLTVRALAKGVEPATTSAALVMTAPAVTCLETSDVREASQLMAAERKARLVVVDADGRLVGVLSLADLVERAPGRTGLDTVRAVLWRDALGPRGGAAREEPLLQHDPAARARQAPSDDITLRPTVFTGAHRDSDPTEFPG
jgi:hypothetical protein